MYCKVSVSWRMSEAQWLDAKCFETIHPDTTIRRFALRIFLTGAQRGSDTSYINNFTTIDYKTSPGLSNPGEVFTY